MSNTSSHFDDLASGRVSATRLHNLLRGSTYAALLVQYGRAVVPLRELSESMLGTTPERAQVLAKAGELGLPVFRALGPRSLWQVHLYDLAQHIDARRTEAGAVDVATFPDEETEKPSDASGDNIEAVA